MRRIHIYLVIVVFLSGITMACKKDWTCQCEPSENSMEELTHHPIEGKTKKDADATCKEYNTEGLDCALR